jgi:hypothetical protein
MAKTLPAAKPTKKKSQAKAIAPVSVSPAFKKALAAVAAMEPGSGKKTSH